MVVIETILCLKNKLVHCLKRYLPLLEKFIFGPDDACLFPRTIFLYFYGTFLGYMLWKYFLLQIPFIPTHVTILTVVIMTSFGALSAVSRKFRCITSLSLISFCGKSGRSLLRAIVVAFLIAGPLNNILINAREVVKVFTCSSVLTYNMTKTRLDLMSKPFMNAMKELKDDIPKIADDFERIDDIINPIVEEIELEDDLDGIGPRDLRSDAIESPLTYNRRYEKKLEERCHQQIQAAIDRCKSSFQDAYLRCRAAMPVVINYLLCFPLKLDIFCQFTRVVGSICTPHVDKDLGENYVDLKRMHNGMKGNHSGVSMNYTTMEMNDVKPLIAIKEAGKEVLKEFDGRKEIVQKVLYFIRTLLAYVFIRIVYDAFAYHNKYLNKISYDNYYTTKYFKTLDERRKLRNQRTVLPLRKHESRYVIDPSKSKKSRLEYKNLIGSVLVTTMHVAFASCFIILNILLTEILKMVHEHAQIDYIQSGEHKVNITVNGEGVIADMIRKTLSKFNTDETVVTFLSNEACLPNPTVIPNRFYIEIYGTYFVIVLLILNEIYVHRLRWLVCASTYPKRQKYRILYLYNKILKDRRNFTTMMKYKLKSIRYDDEADKDSFLDRIFGDGKNCVICDEKVTKKTSGDFVVCKDANCHLSYCMLCYQDAGNQCLRCEGRNVRRIEI